jgi:hypothetical protein
MTKYLRSRVNGIIFDWNERLAKNPSVEVLTEQEAYPERFAPIDLSKRKSTINLTVDAAAITPPPVVAPELLAEASRPFGGPKATRVTRKPATTTSSETIGLSFGEI